MTGRTSVLWFRRGAHVLRVIELHIEVLFESIRKRFEQKGVVHIHVADRTDRAIGRRVLRPMASNKAILHAGKTGPAGVIRAVVTVRATDRRMALAGMQEF